MLSGKYSILLFETFNVFNDGIFVNSDGNILSSQFAIFTFTKLMIDIPLGKSTISPWTVSVFKFLLRLLNYN